MNKPITATSVEVIHYGSNLVITFTGENYGNGLLDTRVEIQAGTLCWITWKDKREFIDELNNLISKYAI